MQELSIRDCVSFGWRTFTVRPKLFIAVGVLLFLAVVAVNSVDSIVASIVNSGFGEESTFAIIVTGISSLVALGLSFLVDMGKTSFYLKAHDDVSETDVKDLYRPHPYWKYVGTSLMYGIAVFIGIILLIIPGIIIGLIFGFALYRVIDAGSMPVEAFKESAALTKGNRWNLFLLGLALVGINILGFFALIVGLLVTLPVTTLALVHAYRTLEAAHMPLVEDASEVPTVA